MKETNNKEVKNFKTITYDMKDLDLATANNLIDNGIVIYEIDTDKGIVKAYYEER